RLIDCPKWSSHSRSGSSRNEAGLPMRLYQAGPLFTQAEKAFNAEVCAQLRRDGHQVFLPQENEPALEPGYPPRIFRDAPAGLDGSEAVVAVLDGSDIDSGTAWECGYAYAKGKPVFGLRTDFRNLGPEERCNLMVQECCVTLGATVPELLAALRE